jgi:hypothetical protein
MRSFGCASAISWAWLCAAVVATAVVSIAYAAQTAGSEYMPICNLPKCLNPQVTSKSGIGTTAATVEAKIAPTPRNGVQHISHETSIVPKSESKAAGWDLEVSIVPLRTAWLAA